MSRRFHGPVSVFLDTFWSTLPRENGSSHPDSLASYGTRSTKNWKLTLFFHYIFQTFIVITSRFGTPHVHRLNKAKSLYIFGQNHPVRKFSLHITTNQYPFILPFLWIGNSNNITFSQKKRWILIFFKKDMIIMEVRGFEPRTSRMQSERSTTELHPLISSTGREIYWWLYEIQVLNILNREFSRTWPASLQMYWNKRKLLLTKRIQFQPHSHLHGCHFKYCFGTPVRPTWRPMKALQTKISLSHFIDSFLPLFKVFAFLKYFTFCVILLFLLSHFIYYPSYFP